LNIGYFPTRDFRRRDFKSAEIVQELIAKQDSHWTPSLCHRFWMGSIRPGVKSLRSKQQTMEIVFDDYFAKMELHSSAAELGPNSGSYQCYSLGTSKSSQWSKELN
jgi:hypothetical protein